ncbi:MAG TPA: DUF4142 domain-containing protein [Dokdonella sp.]|nr:DUF4142 domain-containing protein [Dokdonella sp.]
MNTKLIALAAAVAAGGASAATTQTDRAFVEKAAIANAGEIAVGRLAATHSQDANVKAFGERMVNDHTKAAEALEAAAKKDGIELPPAPAGNPDAERLARLNGVEFDRAFGDRMRADHAKAVALFSEESKASGDSHVKAFAAKTLPTLEDHKKLAQSLPGAAK